MNIRRAGLLADKLPVVVARAVLVVSGQDLVAGLQRQRAGNDIDSMRGVGNVDEIIRSGIEIFAKRLARLAQKPVNLAPQEKNWLAFQPALPILVGSEDRLGRRAEGAVVEECNCGVEEEVPLEIVHGDNYSHKLTV